MNNFSENRIAGRIGMYLICTAVVMLGYIVVSIAKLSYLVMVALGVVPK